MSEEASASADTGETVTLAQLKEAEGKLNSLRDKFPDVHQVLLHDDRDKSTAAGKPEALVERTLKVATVADNPDRLFDMVKARADALKAKLNPDDPDPALQLEIDAAEKAMSSLSRHLTLDHPANTNF